MGKVKEWLPTLTLAIFTMLICTYVYGIAITSGDSMNNTLKDGDILIAQKFNLENSINRFDVISFKHLKEGKSAFFVKRVIGLPGETVQIIENNIYINGELIEENYGKEEMKYQGIASDKLTLKEGEYFVLGDNRNNSLDSRYEEVGIINVDDINAKMICRIIPFLKKL